MRFKEVNYEIFVDPGNIYELKEVRLTDVGLEIGSSITLSELKKFLENKTLVLDGNDTDVPGGNSNFN